LAATDYRSNDATASVNLTLSAIRKLATEAAENGLLDRSVAQGSLKGVRQSGNRAGNWLTREQARDLLAQPDIDTEDPDGAHPTLCQGCDRRLDGGGRFIGGSLVSAGASPQISGKTPAALSERMIWHIPAREFVASQPFRQISRHCTPVSRNIRCSMRRAVRRGHGRGAPQMQYGRRAAGRGARQTRCTEAVGLPGQYPPHDLSRDLPVFERAVEVLALHFAAPRGSCLYRFETPFDLLLCFPVFIRPQPVPDEGADEGDVPLGPRGGLLYGKKRRTVAGICDFATLLEVALVPLFPSGPQPPPGQVPAALHAA
jgi:hypothetical protein